MRIGRALAIPAILALGAAGSILASAAATVAAGPAHSIHAQASATTPTPDLYYHA